jgi:hypothetical protein
MIFLCNENLNTFLTRLRKLFKGGKYSREETIRENTVYSTIVDQIFKKAKSNMLIGYLFDNRLLTYKEDSTFLYLRSYAAICEDF